MQLLKSAKSFLIKLGGKESRSLAETIALAETVAIQVHHAAPAARKLLDAACEFRDAIAKDSPPKSDAA